MPLPGVLSEFPLRLLLLPLGVWGCSGGAESTGDTPNTNLAPTAAMVEIEDLNGGQATNGDLLHGSYAYDDAESDPEGDSSMQWLRDGQAIADATSLSYTLTPADIPSVITFVVVPVAASGTPNGSAAQASTAAVNGAPVAAAVSLLDSNGGGALAGDLLTGTYEYHDVDGDIEGSTTFRWLRDGEPVVGATTPSYLISLLDVPSTLTFEVTPAATTGAPIGEAATATVEAGNAPPTVSMLGITDATGDVAIQGDLLTGVYTYADAESDPEGASIIRWLRDGVPIDGAAASTYALTVDDIPSTITFEVTPVAASGAPIGSPGTADIAAVNAAPTIPIIGILDGNGGLATSGDLLTGTYTYFDVDQDPEGATTFRWLQDGLPIPGATSTTYTLLPTSIPSTIAFEVTPLAATGSPVGDPAVATVDAVNAVPTVSMVSILDGTGGAAILGDLLTGSYTYEDVDSDPEGLTTFRWLRNGAPIAGATASSYALAAADIPSTIAFEVTPIALTGAPIGDPVLATIGAVNAPPSVSMVAILDGNGGTAILGDALAGTYSYADIDGDLEGSSTFRWLRDGAPIPGATTELYALSIADIGSTIAFEVTPVAATGAAIGDPASATILAENAAPTASMVTITDANGADVVLGDVLNATYTYGDVDGDPEGATTFRWLRGALPIPGAISTTYTLTALDIPATITFEVTPIAASGTAIGAPATATIDTVNAAPTATMVSILDVNGGDAIVGDALTGSYVYDDVDSDLEGLSVFRWLRNGVVIPGATATGYTLVAADIPSTITFEVTPIALTGTTNGPPATATIAAVNAPPTAASVAIADANGDDAISGDLLAGSYVYSDPDSDPEGLSTFRWLRDGAPISGATATNYTLTAADIPSTVTFEVTPVAAAGDPTGDPATATIAAVNAAPVASLLAITDANGGDGINGDLLTGSYTYSDVDGDPEGATTFRWLRNGIAIPGATGTGYTITLADVPSTITFEVTPVAVTGTTHGTAEGTTIPVVNGVPTATMVSILDINGDDAVSGDALTGSYTYSDVDVDLEGASTFRWLRDGNPIGGATASTYTLAAADIPSTMTFEVTPVALTGASPGQPGTATIAAVNAPPSAAMVTIIDANGGDAYSGDLLTGSYTYADVDADAEGSTTFRWLRDGAAIGGATSVSYTLTAADVPSTVTFEVTPVAATGALAGDPATATISTVNAPPSAGSVAIADPNGGEALVTDVLMGSYAYDDVDDDTEGTSTFRWLRDGLPILGATGQQYTLELVDIPSTITFEVTPVAATGAATGAPGTATIDAVNGAPAATMVTITDGNGGDAIAGDALMGSYSYSDPEADLEGTSTFRWLRDGAPIAGATGTGYTLVAPDIPSTVTFEVTPIALTGSTTGDPQAATIAAVNGAPTATRVSITDANGGDAHSGDLLSGTYTYGDVDSDPEGMTTFRWLRDGTPIGGATSATYTLTAADVPSTVTFEVTPIATTGSTVGDPASATIEAVNAPPTAASVAIADGNGMDPEIGDVLTGSYSYSDIDGDSEGGSTYRWLRGGSAIAGATSITYTLVGADVPALVSFEVTPVAATGAAAGDPASATINTGFPPTVLGRARFRDVDASGTANSGDEIVVPFDQDVVVGAASDDDLELVVASDTFGAGATVAAGPASHEVTVTLGAAPTLRTRGGFQTGSTLANAPSGIDVAAVLAADAIEGSTGTDAAQSVPIDIAPALIDSGQTLGSSSTGAIAAGDLDSDGDVDLVEANGSGQANRVYLNSGTGSMSIQILALGSSDSTSLAIGDIDADGDLDVVFGNGGVAPNRVFVNDGSGMFSDSLQLLGVSDTQGVALVDLDGDGDLDLATSNGTLGANRTYLNNGLGDFTATAELLGLESNAALAAGDVDGDGDMDLVIAGPGVQPNRVYTNTDALGDFADSGQTLGANDCNGLALADFDGDGDLDLACANGSGEGNQIFVNDGSGTFASSGQSLGTTASVGVIAVDLDRDSDVDLFFSSTGGESQAWWNDGAGGFTAAGTLSGSADATAAAAADVDSDGDLDVAVAIDGAANELLLNSAAGTFGTTVLNDAGSVFASSTTLDLDAGDVDGDGDIDLVLSNTGAANRIALNDGSGVFTDAGQALGSNTSTAAVLVDMDNDGDLDWIVANNVESAKVYENDGSGSFSLASSFFLQSGNHGAAAGDVDGDGNADVLFVGPGGPHTLYLGNGAGGFVSTGQLIALGAPSTEAEFGDVDGDGDLDLVLANAGATANRVYLNNGSGTMSSSGQTLGSADSDDCALADFDRDGDLDLVFANDGANRVYLNSGSGTFTVTADTLGTSDSRSVAVGDLDGDGNLDLFFGNHGASGEVDVAYLGDGTGSFAASTYVLGIGRTSSVVLIDIDGDGDLDGVSAPDVGTDTLFVYRGE